MKQNQRRPGEDAAESLPAGGREPRPLSERFKDWELHFTHLQRIVDDLNEVVLAQQQKLERMEKLVKSLQEQLGALETRLETPTRREDEKPPHY